MHQGDVQVTLVAGFKGFWGDAVPEGELVVLERGEDVGPLRHHLLAFVVADRQHISDGCLQRDATLHDWAIDAGQPPLQYLTLSGDNGGSQPVLGVNTQIAEGMAWSRRQNAMTSKAKPVPGAWMLAWNQGF